MQRFKNILFLADASQGEEAALGRAADLAVANKAKLVLFDAVDVDEHDSSDREVSSALAELHEAHLETRRKELEQLGEATRSTRPGLSVAVDTQQGNIARSAIRKVVSDGHDLVIKAPEGGGRLNMLFGSIDQKLMRKCPCPVWIIKPSGRTSFQRILAAVDLNPNEPAAELLARKILELSTSLARDDESELHVVHAWRLAAEAKLRGGSINIRTVEKVLSDMEAAHKSGIDALVEKFPYERMKVHVLKGDAGDVIAQFAEDCDIDLLVIGTVGRTGIPGLFIGNTAEKVLSRVDCSVLTVKPEGFETPIQ